MTPPAGTFATRYARFVLVTLVLGAVVAAVGYLPTRKLAGAEGISAMFAGFTIAVIASWCGGVVVCLSVRDSAERINRLLGATALRLFAAAGLAVAVALGTEYATTPLLLWVAIAYMAMLVGETLLVVRWAKMDNPNPGSGELGKTK